VANNETARLALLIDADNASASVVTQPDLPLRTHQRHW
jgi:hypothetical protein